MNRKTQFVDVPMSGWHRPRPGEMDVMTDEPAAHESVARHDIFLCDGDHPDWMWVVYQEHGKTPVAAAMYRNGQSVELPTKVAKMLIRVARAEAGPRTLH